MSQSANLKILLLSGGVGGAKMAEGLAHSPYAEHYKIIGNVADDQAFHGLWVSPDIDTLTYTLADQIDKTKGWGLANESDQVLRHLKKLGAETWMYLGDKDFATHIFRTHLKNQGLRASAIAATIAEAYGVATPILLPTDDCIQTQVQTAEGWLSFQNYFVKSACQPDIIDIRVAGIEAATATPEALAAIKEADIIVLAPSNPIVSIDPILSVPEIGQAIANSRAFKVAVSPIIAGKTVKGPADKMMQALGYASDVIGVANFYLGMVDALVIDQQDAHWLSQLRAKIPYVMSTQTLMHTRADKVQLAQTVIQFCQFVISDQLGTGSHDSVGNSSTPTGSLTADVVA